jgi:hypothetical protein
MQELQVAQQKEKEREEEESRQRYLALKAQTAADGKSSTPQKTAREAAGRYIQLVLKSAAFPTYATTYA